MLNYLQTGYVVLLCFLQAAVNESLFLEPHEEKIIFKHYEKRLLDFCAIFKPVMPKSVVVGNCKTGNNTYRKDHMVYELLTSVELSVRLLNSLLKIVVVQQFLVLYFYDLRS